MPASSRAPLAALPARSRPALAWLAAIGIGRALALIVIAEAITRGIVAIIDGSDAWRDAMAAGIGAVTVRALMEWLTQVVARRSALGAKESLRSKLAERITARGGRDVPGGAGSLTVLATRGLDDLDSYYSRFLPALVGAAVIPPVVGTRILLADWVSAVVVLVTIPLVPVFMILIGLHTEDRTARAMDEISRLSDHLVELARGLPVLVGLGRAAEQTRALQQIAASAHRRTMTTLRTVFLSSLALELISTVSVAVVAVFIGVRLVDGTMPLEAGLLALILAPECYLPLRQVGAAFHASEDGVEALERVNRILAMPLADLPWRKAPITTGDAAHVVLDRVTIRYAGRPEPIVTDLSFEVPAGSIVALGGPSGSGKSSVMAAIAGLLGRTPDGTDVAGSIAGVEPDRIAWVPQHPEPFAETVREEIALALRHDDAGDIARVLAETGAVHLIDRAHAQLSQGELRRVALARALASIHRGATLFLLDEPTAHLDPDTAAIVRRVINDLRGRVTIILVAHDNAARALADRVIEVGTGELHREAVRLQPAAPVAAPSVPATGERLPDDVSAPNQSLQRVWQVLIDLIRPLRPRFLAAAGLGVMAAVASVALTSVSAWLIVRASEQPPILHLMVAIVGVRFFGIGRAVFRYTQRLWMHDAILGAMTGVRVRVWTSLASFGPAVKRFLHGEDTLDRLIGDVDRLRDLSPRVLLPPVVGTLAGAVAVIVFWSILPTAGILMLAGSIVALVIAPGIALMAGGASRRNDVLVRSAVMRRFAALVASAADLRVNGMAESAQAQLANLDRRASSLEQKSAWSLELGSGIVTLACGVTALAMLAVGSPAVSRGEISHGLLAVLVLTPLAIVEVFKDVVEAVQHWLALRTVADRFSPLLEDPVAARTSTPVTAGDIESPIDTITLDHLGARWPDAPKPAFDDITAEVRRGEWLVVVGPSGAGKSTLLSVVMGFLHPESGRYLIDGIDTAKIPVEAIRRRLSWCPQEAHLFDSTLRGNLLLARPKADAPSDTEMQKVLRRVGLSALLDRLPEGLEARVGSRGARLSGGERQRVAIARALLTEADVVLLDEPTAHLDREAAEALLADLRVALADRIVVMVTHHLADIAPEDRVLRLGGTEAAARAHGAVQLASQSTPGW